MEDAVYRSHDEVREQGRKAALAGREIWANPHLGGEAVLWFDGWREVPDEQRGNWPELLPKPRTMKRRAGRGRAIGAFVDAIKAEVDEAEAHTPRPWGEL